VQAAAPDAQARMPAHDDTVQAKRVPVRPRGRRVLDDRHAATVAPAPTLGDVMSSPFVDHDLVCAASQAFLSPAASFALGIGAKILKMLTRK
jgi:hypothetical protein